MNPIRIAILSIAMLVGVTACPIAMADPYPSYSLTGTISLAGYDLKNMGTDGSHLLVVHAVPPGFSIDQKMAILSTSGVLLNDLQTGPRTFAVAGDGSSYVLAKWPSGTSQTELHRMAADGTIGPTVKMFNDGVNALNFDGTSLLVGFQATDFVGPPFGELSTTLLALDPTTFDVIDSITLTTDTGTPISGTPVVEIAHRDGDWFLAYQGVSKISRFDAAGNLVQQINTNALGAVAGFAFLGADLYVADSSLNQIYRYSPSFVPEPTTFVTLIGGVAIGIWVRRRSR